jgi:hypothetical protein
MKNLNVRSTNVKVLEENIGEKFLELALAKIFWYDSQNIRQQKQK